MAIIRLKQVSMPSSPWLIDGARLTCDRSIMKVLCRSRMLSWLKGRCARAPGSVQCVHAFHGKICPERLAHLTRRVKILSTTPMVALLAGTKAPRCAMNAMVATCLM